MQLIEAKRRQAQDSRDPLLFELNSKTKEKENLKESKAGKVFIYLYRINFINYYINFILNCFFQKKRSLLNLCSNIKMLKAQKVAHQTEMSTER